MESEPPRRRAPRYQPAERGAQQPRWCGRPARPGGSRLARVRRGQLVGDLRPAGPGRLAASAWRAGSTSHGGSSLKLPSSRSVAVMAGRVSRVGRSPAAFSRSGRRRRVDALPMQMLEEAPRRTARAAARRARARHPRCTSPTSSCAPGSARSVTVVNDLGQTIVPLLIAAPALVAGRPPLRRAGCAPRGTCSPPPRSAGGSGQAVWTWFEVVLDEPVPYPGLADVGYLGAVPFLLAGVLVFPSHSLRSIGRARAVLDGLITTAAMVFASYGTFLGVVYTASEGELLERGIAVTYPVADVVTVAVVLAVLARRSRSPGGTAAARGGGRRVPRGRRQRVRLPDRDGHLRERPRVRPGLAARLRAARRWRPTCPSRRPPPSETRPALGVAC